METKKLSDLKFDEHNINKGSEYGQSLLEKSLREVGAGRSILLDKNGVIMAGNQTIQKAGELGFEEVVVIPSDGRKIIAVQRTDIDINSPEGAKMKILDNSVSKHNYVEDAEMIELVCEDYELQPVELGLFTSHGHKVNELNEWVGMPEFEAKEDMLKIIIHFNTEADRQEFADKYKLDFVKKQQKAWSTIYPFKQRDDLTSLKYE